MTNISHKWSCLQETSISSTSLNYFHGYHNVNGFICPVICVFIVYIRLSQSFLGLTLVWLGYPLVLGPMCFKKILTQSGNICHFVNATEVSSWPYRRTALAVNENSSIDVPSHIITLSIICFRRFVHIRRGRSRIRHQCLSLDIWVKTSCLRSDVWALTFTSDSTSAPLYL